MTDNQHIIENYEVFSIPWAIIIIATIAIVIYFIDKNKENGNT